jgi:hypothetical protein
VKLLHGEDALAQLCMCKRLSPQDKAFSCVLLTEHMQDSLVCAFLFEAFVFLRNDFEFLPTFRAC